MTNTTGTKLLLLICLLVQSYGLQALKPSVICKKFAATTTTVPSSLAAENSIAKQPPPTSLTHRIFTTRLGASTSASTPEVVDEQDAAKKEWTKKRVHNTQAFRSAAILGALIAAGVSSKSPLTMIPNTSSATVHVLSFGTWFGTVAYTTFVAGITMFKNLPRQTFGKLQSKLFPKYFSLCSFTLVLQLITLRSLATMTLSIKSQRALGVALVMTLINQFYLEPKSTENMFERYRMEDADPKAEETAEYKKLKSSFGKFHGISSLLNLVALCAGVAHAFYMAAALV